MELLDIGVREYREAFFEPYRIIYRVIEETVHILIIVDGRRNIATPTGPRAYLPETLSCR